MLTEEDIRVERVWCGESTGTKLVLHHTLTGLTVQRVIGFEEESPHRRELMNELSALCSTRYPPADFVLDTFYAGPDKPGSLGLRHIPSSLAVGRILGDEPVSRYQREMVVELFAKLRAHESSRRK